MKYRIIMIYPDGERVEEDELYDSYEEAESIALDNCGAFHVGGEILELSNPGDYPYDPDEEADYEIIEVDE